MSTEASVPRPRIPDPDHSGSGLFATLLEEAPIGFAFFDTELRFLGVNRTLAEIQGLPVEKFIGRRPHEVFPDDLGEQVETALRKVLAEDCSVLEADLRIESGGTDGQERETVCWALSWFPAHGSDGKIFGIALIAVDVTERQRAEEIIRRKEERYRSLVEASSQIVWVTSPNGAVTEDSPEWRAITGQTLEQYLGNGWLDAVHPEDRERTEEAWRDCVLNRRVLDATYRIHTKSGGYRYYDVRAVPIRRGDEVVEWVGANTDVTGQREAEEMRAGSPSSCRQRRCAPPGFNRLRPCWPRRSRSTRSSR